MLVYVNKEGFTRVKLETLKVPYNLRQLNIRLARAIPLQVTHICPSCVLVDPVYFPLLVVQVRINIIGVTYGGSYFQPDRDGAGVGNYEVLIYTKAGIVFGDAYGDTVIKSM
jgi:hypothetical protein